MRIFEQEFEKGGNNKKRVLFAVGFEEVDILCDLLSNALIHMPRRPEVEDTLHRMRNMQKAMSVYLGRSKERPHKDSSTACPHCRRQVRGEKALVSHLRDVHSKETQEIKTE